MNCPGLDHCALQEHCSYRNCSDGPGQCQELTDEIENQERVTTNAVKAFGVAVMVLITFACVLVELT